MGFDVHTTHVQQISLVSLIQGGLHFWLWLGDQNTINKRCKYKKNKFIFGFQSALVLVMRQHYMLVFLLYYAATLYSLWHLCVTIVHYKKRKLVFIELEKKCYTVQILYCFMVLKIDSIGRKKLRQFYIMPLSVVFFYSIP